MRSIAVALLLPPGGLIVLGFVGLIIVRSRQRLGQAILAASLVALYLLSTPLVSNCLLRLTSLDNATSPDARAIVVLGAGMREHARDFDGPDLDSLSLERVRYAARLARKTHLPVALSGGPVFSDGPSLASQMATSLQEDFGIAPRWLEQNSDTTAENATFIARILRREGINQVYLVTQAWHMARAKLAFERAGLDAIPAGTGFPDTAPLSLTSLLPAPRGLLNSYYAAHEIVGYSWYYLTYRGARKS
jgi:uncharacterized SAM-binding protein YcdF (DUF218 family)